MALVDGVKGREEEATVSADFDEEIMNHPAAKRSSRASPGMTIARTLEACGMSGRCDTPPSLDG
jgi:hypothetical protein